MLQLSAGCDAEHPAWIQTPLVMTFWESRTRCSCQSVAISNLGSNPSCGDTLGSQTSDMLHLSVGCHA